MTTNMAASMIDNMDWVCWGANSYGQLGVGHIEDQLLPISVPALRGATSIYGGGGHTFARKGDGEMMCCGWNNKGQLGIEAEVTQVTSPIPIPPSTAWINMAPGWDFTLALTSAGGLYSWGSNGYGQLGQHSSTTDCVKEASCVNDVGPVKDAACGLRHSVVCTVSGDVMCCGYGKKGQVGIVKDCKAVKEQRQFIKVNLPKKQGNVKQVVAGAYHSAALTDVGELFVWGDNKHGQLAIDPSLHATILEPIPVAGDCFHGEKVTEIHSGWTHMLAVTELGSVYTWGRGDYGQLGRPLPTRMDHVPSRIPVPKPQKIVVGSEHNLLLTEVGELLSWGWNEHGLCATGDETNQHTPSKIKYFIGQSVADIACGMGHCFARVNLL